MNSMLKNGAEFEQASETKFADKLLLHWVLEFFHRISLIVGFVYSSEMAFEMPLTAAEGVFGRRLTPITSSSLGA